MVRPSFPTIFLFLLLRYLVVAGGVYLWIWVLRKKRWAAQRLQPRLPERAMVRREILWSIGTTFIFSVAGDFSFAAYERGWTLVYEDLAKFGWLYFGFSILALMAIHDTYFYWMHRLMHTRMLFQWIHRVHHDSRTPTPFAAFSFHPLEAIIEAAILPLLLFVIPVHPLALFLFLSAMTLLSVANHAGHEVYPKALFGNPLGRCWLTPTHHDMHHQRFQYGFGLYFTLWDRWMGTEDPQYTRLIVKKSPSSLHPPLPENA